MGTLSASPGNYGIETVMTISPPNPFHGPLHSPWPPSLLSLGPRHPAAVTPAPLPWRREHGYSGYQKTQEMGNKEVGLATCLLTRWLSLFSAGSFSLSFMVWGFWFFLRAKEKMPLATPLSTMGNQWSWQGQRLLLRVRRLRSQSLGPTGLHSESRPVWLGENLSQNKTFLKEAGYVDVAQW